MDAEKEQLDLNLKMIVGIVANAVTGPMSAKHVVDVEMEVEEEVVQEEEEAVQEEEEVDLRK